MHMCTWVCMCVLYVIYKSMCLCECVCMCSMNMSKCVHTGVYYIVVSVVCDTIVCV